MVSKTRKYIDFDISGLQDRYIDLHDGLRIESPLILNLQFEKIKMGLMNVFILIFMLVD